MSLFTAPAAALAHTALLHTAFMALPSTRSAITAALPEVVGAILVVFLTLAVGFVIVAYTEASSRRMRTPRIITKERAPRGELSPLVLPILLLALLVAVSMLMGIDF